MYTHLQLHQALLLGINTSTHEQHQLT